MVRRKVWICAGTAGELIKLYPIIVRAEERGIPWNFLFTGQSAINFWLQWDDFSLARDRAVTLLPSTGDLRTSPQALTWFRRAILLTRRQVSKAFETARVAPPKSTDVLIVHGDTLSTLVGAWLGRRLGLSNIAHVEAGLRSASLFKPFPEEVTRRIVSLLANLHFPQDEAAHRNLENAGITKGIHPTSGNSLYDALVDMENLGRSGDLPPQPYVVANLHRFENLNSPERWRALVDTVIAAARDQPVHFVQHAQAEQKVNDDPLAADAMRAAGVILLPRQTFTGFIRMIKEARYVITDGGSNQEECAYLGKPCLILRDTTERYEGLSEGSCVLTRFDQTLIDKFLRNPESYQRAPAAPARSPSHVILDVLETHL